MRRITIILATALATLAAATGGAHAAAAKSCGWRICPPTRHLRRR
jgi:hypothetical protein